MYWWGISTCRLGMAIFARPASTRPGSTLMGRGLPSLIRNRVGYGFLKKKTRSGSRSGLSFIKKIWDLTWNPARIKTRYPEITKIPFIYIYTYNLSLIPHFFSSNSELMLPHTHNLFSSVSPLSLTHSPCRRRSSLPVPLVTVPSSRRRSFSVLFSTFLFFSFFFFDIDVLGLFCSVL